MKKVVISVFLIIAVCLLSLFATPTGKLILSSAKADQRRTVIIDAGHGGLTNTID